MVWQKVSTHGLNRQCKYLLLSYAFETLEMERVEFRADARNQRSLAAMQGIGCTLEGIFTEQLYCINWSSRQCCFKYNKGRMGSWAQAKPFGQNVLKLITPAEI